MASCREFLAALCALPTPSIGEGVDFGAATMRAPRLAIVGRPANFTECGVSLFIAHPRDPFEG